MKKVFIGRYREDIADDIREYIRGNAPTFTVESFAVIVEVLETN